MVGCVAVGSVPLAAVGEVIVRVGVKTAGLVVTRVVEGLRPLNDC